MHKQSVFLSSTFVFLLMCSTAANAGYETYLPMQQAFDEYSKWLDINYQKVVDHAILSKGRKAAKDWIATCEESFGEKDLSNADKTGLHNENVLGCLIHYAGKTHLLKPNHDGLPAATYTTVQKGLVKQKICEQIPYAADGLLNEQFYELKSSGCDRFTALYSDLTKMPFGKRVAALKGLDANPKTFTECVDSVKSSSNLYIKMSAEVICLVVTYAD